MVIYLFRNRGLVPCSSESCDRVRLSGNECVLKLRSNYVVVLVKQQQQFNQAKLETIFNFNLKVESLDDER